MNNDKKWCPYWRIEKISGGVLSDIVVIDNRGRKSKTYSCDSSCLKDRCEAYKDGECSLIDEKVSPNNG